MCLKSLDRKELEFSNNPKAADVAKTAFLMLSWTWEGTKEEQRLVLRGLARSAGLTAGSLGEVQSSWRRRFGAGRRGSGMGWGALL